MKRRSFLSGTAALLPTAWPSNSAGAPAEPGVGSGEIVFGQTLDRSSSRSAIALAYTGGAKLAFEASNRTGGIHGRKIRVVHMDDSYDTERALANAKSLVEQEQVFSLLHSVGTGIAAKLIPYTERQGVPYIHPLTGADQVRAPVMPSRQTFFLRASYNRELEKMIVHLKTLGIANIALVYEDESFGQGVRSQVNALIKIHGLQLSAIGVLPFNQPNQVANAVATISKSQPTAVIVGSAGPAVGQFIGACQSAGLHSQYYCLSVSNVDSLNKTLGNRSQGIIVSQVMPSLTQSTLPVVHQYRRAVAEQNGTENAFGLEGYISGLMITQALRLAGQNLTRSGFSAAMANPGSNQIGGFPISLEGETRNGSPFVQLAMIRSDGRLLV